MVSYRRGAVDLWRVGVMGWSDMVTVCMRLRRRCCGGAAISEAMEHWSEICMEFGTLIFAKGAVGW
jgi:hypothetical protein